MYKLTQMHLVRKQSFMELIYKINANILTFKGFLTFWCITNIKYKFTLSILRYMLKNLVVGEVIRSNHSPINDITKYAKFCTCCCYVRYATLLVTRVNNFCHS